MNKAELFIDCKNKLGEGITWDDDNQTLYWLDIPMPSKLYKYSLETNNTLQFDMPEMITAMAIRPNNEVLIASHHGINNYNTTNKSTLATFGDYKAQIKQLITFEKLLCKME